VPKETAHSTKDKAAAHYGREGHILIMNTNSCDAEDEIGA
jgi:hypothetical protein